MRRVSNVSLDVSIVKLVIFPCVVISTVVVVKTTSVKSTLIKTGRIRTVSMAHNGPEAGMDGDYRGQSEDTRHIIIKYSLE